MYKKFIIGLICGIFLMSIVPQSIGIAEKTNAKETTSPILSNRNMFTSCYIEASGYVSEIDWPAIIKMPNMWKTTWFRPFHDDRAIVTYWQIVFDSSVDMSIYDKEGGQLLWEHSDLSHEQVRIIGYYGIYISSNPDEEKPLHIDISGNALVVFRTARSSIPTVISEQEIIDVSTDLYAFGYISINPQKYEINGFVLAGVNGNHVLSFERIQIKYDGTPIFVVKPLPLVWYIKYNPSSQ